MTAEPPFLEGEVVAEKYRIVRTLGSGGMGMVFAAEHLDLDRLVALKVMVGTEGGNDDAVARFLREARAAARLKSQHVAKVLDVGRLESGAPYLVMELLEGKNLQELISEQGPLPVAVAVDYMLEACEALAEAHGAGIVHRDLKPANLFVARDVYGEQVIKLLDFGISKMLVGGLNSDLKLTDSHSMMGSPVYMSPEQVRSARTVDHRSDIWSLGAVLFELLTGRVVWSGNSLGDVILQVANDPTPSIRHDIDGAFSELDAIVARCMDKNPARRFQHVADLALALSPLGSDRARATLQRVLRISKQGNEHSVTTAIRKVAADDDSVDTSNLPTLLALTDTTAPVQLDDDASRSPPASISSDPTDEPTFLRGELIEPRSKRAGRVVLASAIGLILIAAAIVTIGRGTSKGDHVAKPAGGNLPAAAVPSILPVAALPAPATSVDMVLPSASVPHQAGNSPQQAPSSAKTSARPHSGSSAAPKAKGTIAAPANDKLAAQSKSSSSSSPAAPLRTPDPMSVRR